MSAGDAVATRLPVDIAFTDQSARDAVLATLRAEIAGGDPTGFDPSEENGSIVVAFPSCTVHATLPG